MSTTCTFSCHAWGDTSFHLFWQIAGEIAAEWAIGGWTPRAWWKIVKSFMVFEPISNAHRFPFLSCVIPLLSRQFNFWNDAHGGWKVITQNTKWVKIEKKVGGRVNFSTVVCEIQQISPIIETFSPTFPKNYKSSPIFTYSPQTHSPCITISITPEGCFC